jgi:branched-chain amino acid transport system permease protein
MIQVINGLVYGSFLYLSSVGLVLIFGLRRVTNFAHGGLFMLGAYVSFTVAAYLGFWAGLVVSVAALALLGALLDRFVFRPLAQEDPIVTLLVTFGLLFVIEDVVRTVWGKNFLTVPPPSILSGVVPMFGTTFPAYRLFVIVAALIIAAGLAVWLRSSRIGLYVRASSVDPVTTGLSGTIASPLLALSPSMGGYIIIDCFVVVVTGGLTSFTGVFIAAMLIGQVHNLGIVFVPELASMMPLAIMALVLTVRPQGLAGAGK